MSYILDALKKSEQDRSRGAVPDIKTIHQPAAGASNRSASRPFIFLIVLVVMVAGLGFWIFDKNRHGPGAGIKNNHSDEEIASSQSSDVNVAMAPDSRSIDKDTGDNTSTLETLSQIELAQHLTALREKAENETDSLQRAPTSATVRGKQSTPGNKAQKSDKAEHLKPKSSRPNVVFSDTPLTASAGNRQGSSALTKGQQTGSTLIQSTDSNSPDTENDIIYDIAELPEDVKRNLPSISFAGHVYSSSKSQRSVMLNGKKMREGEEVAKGLMLDQITMDGVVFRSQGYRFKLGALQDWSFQ